ncbi:hypothetical protein RchiOBHm_Chr7g0230031 [Rosa chinensis]|uniref:Uncharacterized protein n=1 Tax=Rosa chinensis TaxID=74649 RepID=A0A2P6PFA5_ROSCH|nr:hypothetical protein RchiOBHm_Chr7g0230031 [Rosa chinensis]
MTTFHSFFPKTQANWELQWMITYWRTSRKQIYRLSSLRSFHLSIVSNKASHSLLSYLEELPQSQLLLRP